VEHSQKETVVGVRVEQVLICEECEGPIDVPDELTADTSCCTGCGVAYFFQTCEVSRKSARIA